MMASERRPLRPRCSVSFPLGRTSIIYALVLGRHRTVPQWRWRRNSVQYSRSLISFWKCAKAEPGKNHTPVYMYFIHSNWVLFYVPIVIIMLPTCNNKYADIVLTVSQIIQIGSASTCTGILLRALQTIKMYCCSHNC